MRQQELGASVVVDDCLKALYLVLSLHHLLALHFQSLAQCATALAVRATPAQHDLWTTQMQLLALRITRCVVVLPF
jgi:hypothetical protein